MLAAGLLLSAAMPQPARAAAPLTAGMPPAGTGTDQPAWRQTHGVLLAVARAGNRLVAVGDRGTVLLSDDVGATWRPVPSGTDELLTATVFSSPTEGWAVGQDSTILHTADAGQHWSTQFQAAGSDQALFSVAVLGQGYLAATGAYALMLETTNASTWTPVRLPNLDEDYHLNCVMQHGADLVVTGEAGHVFIRHNAAWAPMPVPYAGSQFGCLALPDGSMYSFGLRGSLFVSTPAAPAWKRIDTGEQRSIFGGTILSNGFIGLVGSTGLVMLLDPQTQKLRTLPPPTGASLSGIVEAPGGNWVVVGDDGSHVVDPAGPATQAAEVTQ